MEFSDLSYVGPPIDDNAILAELPPALTELLRERNGFIAFRGGLHVRGVCSEPTWHSLRAAWKGDRALWHLFRSLRATDIPFAEDAFGDQFFLREDMVWRLEAEWDMLEPLETGLSMFLEEGVADPVAALRLQPLLAFEAEGGRLVPGQLISVNPPFAANWHGARSYRAISATERMEFLAWLSAQLNRTTPEGTISYTEFRVELDE